MQPTTTFGHWLKERRQALDLTQEGLAERSVLAADRLYPLPDGVDAGAAAAMLIAFTTAHVSLLRRGGFGLITTHDLALTEIQREFGPLAANVHFEDHLEDGRISFDYKLRPGVVQRSNALELMRAVGLDV